MMSNISISINMGVVFLVMMSNINMGAAFCFQKCEAEMGRGNRRPLEVVGLCKLYAKKYGEK